jgi:DNA-binding NtrC family response regulator
MNHEDGAMPMDGEITRETEQLPTIEDKVGDWLVEVQDDAGMRRMRIPFGGLTFGTSRTACVAIHDPTVSAMHCELFVEDGGMRVKDLGSRNGTFLGGARVHDAYAVAGEIVHIGRSTLSLKSASSDDHAVPGEPLDGIVGGSLVMRKLADHVRKIAVLDVPVLILGESGCGKELVARAIHAQSLRRDEPFVAINVAGVPRELVETEMFGHERGAFTGAYQKHRGAFTQAEHGSLFLDEIGDLPQEAQPKLLRALDGYEVKAVGQEGHGRRMDVRLIAATNANLKEKVAAGLFRQDLFHRLEAIVVRIPPLRARRADIAQLAPALLASMNLPGGPPRIHSDAISLLSAHDWPGNVRELRNALSRAVVDAENGVITATTVRNAMSRAQDDHAAPITVNFAKAHLAKCAGNVSRAAREMGLPRTSFRRLVGAGAGRTTGVPPSDEG